ncbi:MAG: AAA family ATPase [Pyrinomonadaceae bacterium]|nr:AAA family ATPase [Pyrinomonadaceae bacterium]
MNSQELSQQLRQIVNAFIRFVKARRREEASFGLAAIFFYIGYNIIKWLPEELKGFVESFRGNLYIPAIFYIAAIVFLIYGIYRIWKLVYTPELPPPTDRPSAIKGPLAFTQADGELFRKLGREEELRKLLGYVEDDQVRMIVLMGASGAGKTSLLRAGLTDIIKGKNIEFHYWEAVPTDSGQALLRAIKENWAEKTKSNADNSHQPLESLEDLVNPSSDRLGNGKHIIVLDQFEQLHGQAGGQIFKLLQKVARKAKPPHSITWIIAFRREFCADFIDIIYPEQEKFDLPIISLHQFTVEQAKDVISQLIAAADLQVENKIIVNLLEAATVDGEVSSVDIGIGLLILSELSARQGGKTVTEEDYHFAGGAEGLLTQYIGRCLDNFPDEDREAIMNAMLALRDAETNQRIAEGKTAAEIIAEIPAELGANERRLKIHLERLTNRDMRLLEFAEANGIDDEKRYRLPHERLIPALNRLAGRLIGELEETKQKFAGAFAAWSKNKASQYLLKGKDLRLVERYQSQIPWGKEESAKLNFLKNSRRHRMFSRVLAVLVIISLTAGGWLANSQYQRYDAQTYLRDNNYPPELHDYQSQLKSFELNGEFNPKRFPWLKCNNLEEFSIMVTESTNSLDGLADILTKCPSLKKLSLDVTSSQVSDFGFLEKLTNLNQLSLDVSSSKVSDFGFLEKLTNLNQLSLDVNNSQVSDVGFLEKLTNLNQLSLDVIGSQVSDFGFLEKLTNLNQLSLSVRGSELSKFSFLEKLTNLNQLSLRFMGGKLSDLDFLEKLPNLTQLSIDFIGSELSKFSFLEKLPNLSQFSLSVSYSQLNNLDFLEKLTNLNQLSLNVSISQLNNLDFLAKLTNLTQLSLNVIGSQVSDFSFLEKLTNLNQLSLAVNNSKVSDFSFLEKLTNLNQLSLDVIGSQVSDFSFLEKLTNLNQLSLDVSNSQVSDVGFLEKLTNLNQLSLSVSFSEVSDFGFLEKMTNLNQLSLNVSGSKVSNFGFLEKMTNLNQFSLNLYESEIRNLDFLQKLNVQKLELDSLTTEQRMSLKTIPKSVSHLRF